MKDADSAIGAGWFVEVDGHAIAELVEPRRQVDTPHWLSYVIVPLTCDSEIKEQLSTLEFWHSGNPFSETVSRRHPKFLRQSWLSFGLF